MSERLDRSPAVQRVLRDVNERRANRPAAHPADSADEEVRRLCPDCRTPEQNALRNGYTCPAHWPLLMGRPMPTVADMRPDHRRTCSCGHRYSDHYPSGPCAAADTPPGQVTGQGCQCKEWRP